MPTFKSKTLFAISAFSLISLWILSVYIYSVLPQTIPIHFDAMGHANNYGDKITLFVLPVLASGLFFLFSYMIKNPTKANYTVAITDQNREWQYGQSIALMQILRMNILIVFLMIEGYTYLSASQHNSRIGILLLPIILILILLPTAYYLYRMLMGPFQKNN